MHLATLDPSSLVQGFRFGPYVVRQCVGRGAMARVYRVTHTALEKDFALKVLDHACLEKPASRRRFLTEGRAAAAVKHPNVVSITDVGVWEGLPYLVMELLEGTDLQGYLERHSPVPGAELPGLMLPVFAGLATAHEAGVVHRDLKPSNIFLAHGPDGEVVPKLLDFGISRVTRRPEVETRATPDSGLMGTPLYMSPEAVRGARDLDARSDQYSLGVVLYECLTGRTPFASDSLLPLLESIAAGRFPAPSTVRGAISQPLERMILTMMSRDPAQRYPSVREAGADLIRLAEPRTQLIWGKAFGLGGSSREEWPSASSGGAIGAGLEPVSRSGATPRQGMFDSPPALVEGSMPTSTLPAAGVGSPGRLRTALRAVALGLVTVALAAGGWMRWGRSGPDLPMAPMEGSVGVATAISSSLRPPPGTAEAPGPRVEPVRASESAERLSGAAEPSGHEAGSSPPAAQAAGLEEAAAEQARTPRTRGRARRSKRSGARSSARQLRVGKAPPKAAQSQLAAPSAPRGGARPGWRLTDPSEDEDAPIFDLSDQVSRRKGASGVSFGANGAPILDTGRAPRAPRESQP